MNAALILATAAGWLALAGLVTGTGAVGIGMTWWVAALTRQAIERDAELAEATGHRDWMRGALDTVSGHLGQAIASLGTTIGQPVDPLAAVPLPEPPLNTFDPVLAAELIAADAAAADDWDAARWWLTDPDSAPKDGGCE